MVRKAGMDRKTVTAAVFALLFVFSLSVNAAQSAEKKALMTQLAMERQRDMSDVVAAMADIEVNLQKLLIASGAGQSVTLLGETALLAQHVETGLSRLPLSTQTASGAMKFAGQMGEYAMALATQVSAGGALSVEDEQQIEGMLTACQGLNAHLMDVGTLLYTEPMEDVDPYAGAAQSWPDTAIAGDGTIDYPSLIYDGPFSDGRTDGVPKGLSGVRITREQARQAAAHYAGITTDLVKDAADSGGRFEAFGFSAETPSGSVSVQVTGQGGHLLWMMPEHAAFEEQVSREDCLSAAQTWLAEMGFGSMESCFVQQYDGMIVANFASVQDGVLLYPDQVKAQISMESGSVVGAECSQYLTNHTQRDVLVPTIGREEAQSMLSDRLFVQEVRLCVIPTDSAEALCWEFEGVFGDVTYYAYIDAHTGEMREILRLTKTRDGEAVI